MANYEAYPTDEDLNGLGGEIDDATGVPAPKKGKKPCYTDMYKMIWQLQQLAALPNRLRGYKSNTDDLDFGVRPGRCTIGGTVIDYAGATAQALTNDATNYIYIDAAGALQVNTTGLPDPIAVPHMPMAEIKTGTASAAGITGLYDFADITDLRDETMLAVAGGDAETVKNSTGGALTAGTHIIRASISGGDVILAVAGSAVQPAEMVLAEDIDDGETGKAVGFGTVTGLDTSSWPAGTRLYMGLTSQWTATPPTGASEFAQVTGFVQVQHASDGVVMAFPGSLEIVTIGTTSLQLLSVTAAILAATLDLTGKSVSVAAPTADAHAATKAYVDALLRGLDWQESVLDEVDFTTSEPGSPDVGDRYINTATGDSSGTTQAVTANYIYEWNGADWTETIPDDGTACLVEDIDVLKVFNAGSWVGIGTGISLDDVVDGSTYKRLAAVDGSHQAATASLGDAIVTAAKLNANQAKQTFIVWVEDLGAGVDITGRPVFVWPVGGTLETIGILTQGAPAGVDDANTAVIELKDDAANSIVSKTYDTANQPPSSDYADLGALNGTHKVLAATEHVTLDVTNGATADLPAFGLVFTITPTDA